eukprot:g13384.t1
MLLRWLPAAALLAVPLEAALLNQIDPLPPQTSPLTFAQSLKEAQDTFAAADKFFAAARLEHARDRESVERMERAVAQHQAEIPGMEFAGMQDPLPLPQIPQRTLPSAFAQSRKIPGMEFAGMQDPLPLPQMPQRTLPSAFAQSRKVLEERGVKLTLNGLIPVGLSTEACAAEDAWAAADKLFAAARLENTRDSVERVEHAVARARRHQAEIPGAEFAGMQAPPAADMHPCKMDCSNQGLCLAGKCMCRDGFYGDLCEHPRCLNDCSGHGQCLTGQCKCSSNYGGEDSPFSFAGTGPRVKGDSDEGLQPADPDPEFFGLPETRPRGRKRRVGQAELAEPVCEGLAGRHEGVPIELQQSRRLS